STNTPDVFLLTLTWTASTRATNPNQQKLLSLRHHAERKLNSPLNVLARKAILMVCLFLFLSLTISAQQFAFDTRTREAYERVLDLQPESAHSMIPNPQTPQELYVVSLAEALELLITENPRNFSDYETAFEKRISRKSRKDNADDIALIAELNLQWAFIYLKFGKELDAALRIRQAYLNAQDVQKRF